MTSPSEFIARMIELTENEMRTEEDEMAMLALLCPFSTLVQHGLALTGLSPVSVSVGLGGRTLVALERSSAHSDSKSFDSHHSFRPGDAIQLQDAAATTKAIKNRSKKSTGSPSASATAVQGVRATVYKVADSRITIALDKRPAPATGEDDDEGDDLPSNVRIIKMSNPATYKRQLFALNLVQRAIERSQRETEQEQQPLSRLTQIALGFAAPASLDFGEVEFIDTNLNDSQSQAVTHALGTELCLVWGPPGTGKTQVLAEIIRQLVSKGERVLVCGGSNLSVDNVLQRLSAPSPHLSARSPISVTRLGHPARVLSALERFTLDSQMAGSDAAGLVTDIKQDLEKLEGQLRRGGKDRIKGSARKDAWAHVRELRRDYRKREGGIVESILKNAQCVVGTTHGVGSKDAAAQQFDTIIIDEAAQCAEPACWIPIALQTGAKRLVLAGDHLQLPPTIRSASSKAKISKKSMTTKSETAEPTETQAGDSKPSTEAARAETAPEETTQLSSVAGEPTHEHQIAAQQPLGGKLRCPATLETTLFERLNDLHGATIRKMLETSYRFSDKICAFPSQALYEGKLVSHSSVAARSLRDLPSVDQHDEDLAESLVFYDTAGLGMLEREGEDGGSLSDSKSNENEAEICRQCVEHLVERGQVPPNAISLVSPYNAQVAILAKSIKARWPDIEVGSIDGLQGRENDVVIISLVRSNERGEVGFLAEKRRLNVAMTRPRRQLIVVGDSSTVSKGSAYLKQWMDFLEEHAYVQVPQ
ncbi:hypothetical protein ACM66B_005523 [Microbotryomycetes sp. NB124-2]